MLDVPGENTQSRAEAGATTDFARTAGGRELQVTDALFRDYARGDGRDDVPLANPEVEEIVAKAVGIAEHLNQTEIRVAHILLAMSLTEDGKKRLSNEPQLNETAMRDACWQELRSLFQLPKKAPRVVVSTELKRLMDAAFSLTLSRNIVNQPLQVEDFLRAIQSSPFREEFAALLTGIVEKEPAVQTLDLAKDMATKLDHYQPRISSQVENLTALGLQLLQLVKELTLTAQELSNTLRRTENRVRNAKRFILANLALSFLVFSVVIAGTAIIAGRLP